jgi:hypothetical protein
MFVMIGIIVIFPRSDNSHFTQNHLLRKQLPHLNHNHAAVERQGLSGTVRGRRMRLMLMMLRMMSATSAVAEPQSRNNWQRIELWFFVRSRPKSESGQGFV